MLQRRIALLLLSLFMLADRASAAEQIEFADEELAQESVMPVFAKKVVVRDRKIQTTGRFELGGGIGLNLIEPLYSQYVFNVNGSYHVDEIHGFGILGYFLNDELSQAGKDLKEGKGLQAGNTFDASLAPTVSSMIFANYEFTAYYGKMSVTKQSTMNLSLYGILGAGMINWSDGADFGFDAGLGQKFYIGSNLSLRFDLILAIYQGPDPTTAEPNNTQTLKSSDLDDFLYVRPFLTGGLSYLF